MASPNIVLARSRCRIFSDRIGSLRWTGLLGTAQQSDHSSQNATNSKSPFTISTSTSTSTHQLSIITTAKILSALNSRRQFFLPISPVLSSQATTNANHPISLLAKHPVPSACVLCHSVSFISSGIIRLVCSHAPEQTIACLQLRVPLL